MTTKKRTPAGGDARLANDQDMKKMVQDRIDQVTDEIAPKHERPKITSEFLHECIFANVLGDGTLYATLFRDQFLYCKNTQEWFEWTGHHWKRDIMGRSLAEVEGLVECYLVEYKKLAGIIAELMNLGDDASLEKIKKPKYMQKEIFKRVKQLRDDKRRNACLKFSHTIKNPLAITGDEFDQKPMLFPCANGVINLETGRIKPGRPADLLSLASPVDFPGIKGQAPLWDETVLQILSGDEEMVAYLQRLFGYAITGLVHEKVFPVFYGKEGWNGRTLIMETISYIMGNLAKSIPSEMLLSSKFVKSSSGPSPDIMSLKGLRMAFCSETDEGHKFSASNVKRLTGKNELVGRNPNDKFQVWFQQTHKLFMESNSQPKAPPNDRSFWERLHLIPFDISFVNRDPQEPHERRAILDLDRQILKEAPGILAWLVRGCLLWQKHGLMPPRKVTDATELYRKNEDLLADYIDECCIREPGVKEKASNLYGQFVTWYHTNIGQKEPSGHWFGRNLSQKFEKIKLTGSCIITGLP